jgi:type I restriction enzyme, R subunit
MKLLRNPDFQRLLVEYKRKEYTFWVAHGTQDVVSSEWLVRGLDGKEYRPEDYLVALSFKNATESCYWLIGPFKIAKNGP